MDDILSRAKKLYALALRGVGGEREQARQILDKLLVKYDLSISDIEDTQVEMRYFHYVGEEQRIILRQVAYKVTDDINSAHGVRYADTKSSEEDILAVECTAGQEVEINFLFDFYVQLWESEKSFMIKAFVQKHQLFGKPDDTASDEMDKTDLRRIIKMMKSLSDADPIRRIESTKTGE